VTFLGSWPVRARVTAAFSAVMAVLLLGVGSAVYLTMSAALLDELDTGLRFRAAALAAGGAVDAGRATPAPGLEEQTEAFEQVLAADGAVLRSSPVLGSRPLLSPAQVEGVLGPAFSDRRVAGVQGRARLLAVPLGGPAAGQVLVVGSTSVDRTDTLHLLVAVLVGADAVALALAALAGWRVATAGLSPVDRMRRQATAITASGLDRRLELPAARDELRRLAVALNDMLDRLDAAAQHDRAFLGRASHELRTPLTALKAELELAATGPAEVGPLLAAVSSARAETDRLVLLANDLLALARTRDGRLPIRRHDVELRELLDAAAGATSARAAAEHVAIAVEAPAATVRVDAARVRQALDNLLDNALRHTPAGSAVILSARVLAEDLEIELRDDGPGFATLAAVQESLVDRSDGLDRHGLDRQGLGLRIVSAVAISHGGEVRLENAPSGGAVVTMTLARAAVADRPAVPV
jgi:two-component system, OmpR family, sensor kinase